MVATTSRRSMSGGEPNFSTGSASSDLKQWQIRRPAWVEWVLLACSRRVNANGRFGPWRLRRNGGRERWIRGCLHCWRRTDSFCERRHPPLQP